MLPDLRIVIAAVLSTFVLTVGVGFFASSRLIQEPKKRTDSLAALDETPVNRIALSWPEPTRPPDQPALDFAVTAKALRNPVRDVTHDAQKPVQESAAKPQIAERSNEIARPAPQLDTSVKVEERVPVTLPAAVAPPAAPPTVAKASPAPTPMPDIRIAVQYPPIVELPPELRTPVIVPTAAAPTPTASSPAAPTPAASAPAASTPAASTPAASAPAVPAAAPSEPKPDSPVTTGSVIDTPAAPTAERPQSDPQIASRPDAEADIRRDVQLPELPKPAPKAARKKPAPKKAAPAKAKRPARAVRRTTRPANPATTAFPFFWGGAVR
jgi:hypothetical protein